MRLAAIWRRDADSLRRQACDYGCAAYADFRELIAASDVDAVVVVVPPTLHREVVCAAAAMGKAVLLEKPAAPNLVDGRAMLEAVRRERIPVLVGQTLRFNSVVRAIKAARHRVGTIHAIRLSQRFESSRPGWLDDPSISGGGVVLHTGIHSFDLLRHLTDGEVDRVFCETAAVRTERTEDNFVATLRFAGGGCLGSVAGSRATESRTGAIEIAGELGQLVGDHVRGEVHFVRGTSVEPIDVEAAVPTVREVLEAFSAVLDGAESPIPLEEGLRAVALVRACYEAVERGEPVGVESIA